MPILLNPNDQQDGTESQVMQSTTRIYDPKFFDKKLTGCGKKIGVINERTNPANTDKQQMTTALNIATKKKSYMNNGVTITTIPTNPIADYMWEYMTSMPVPEPYMLTKIAEKKTGCSDIYITMPVHTVTLQEDVDDSGTNRRTLTPCYQIILWNLNQNSLGHMDLTANQVHAPHNFQKLRNPDDAEFYTDFTCNPEVYLKKVASDLKARGYVIYDQIIADFIQDYELYHNICNRSEEWQSYIDKTIENLISCVSDQLSQQNSPSRNRTILNNLTKQLRYLENYNIPLDLYRNIYDVLAKYFKPSDTNTLCKQNLNLLLSDTMNSLDQNKATLTSMPAGNPNSQLIARFSPQQKAAIQSTNPLILVQAGAGTGKSSVILGRIDYMIESGVKPENIMVLSFTNAAADNITAKNPNVKSMTIAKMIHTIYTANFSNHELSSIETMANSIDIYLKSDQVAIDFKHRLKNIIRNEPNAFTVMNNFTEQHYDDVIRIMNTIKQTCLEMEIIVCYQKIGTFVEPDEITSKYLIIDEVQDNSVFEFIYTLKYVDKHKESLFMVGDCSQTLYEFRASNPKALNVLEGSGVFNTYQLTVNYRSNQEILDFANVVLKNIEANQYANIQLQANSLTPVTEQSFTDKVHFHYERLLKASEFAESFGPLVATEVKPYMDARLAKKEQIVFLAYTRKHVNMMKDILKHMYPNTKIVSIMPEKTYNSTIFSDFIRLFWDQVRFAPTKGIMPTIVQMIYAKLQDLVYYGDPQKAMPAVQTMCQKWMTEQAATINVWQAQMMSNQITTDRFMELVRENMLDYEIRNNAIKQSLLATKNKENKENSNTKDADFILSTIHSAKGLEFKHAIVLYKNKNDMAEDEKRMYYVAFTRAMESEFILAYDTTASPKIETDYKTIVNTLHAKANQTQPQITVNAPIES